MRNDDVDARQLAFRLLARIVAEYVETGRQPRGAGLKTELQRRTGGFSESLLGYESFGAFLESAAQSGFVQLRKIPGGDIEVSMPGSRENPSQLVTPRKPSPERTTYIRRDLWRCFLDWTPGWIRLYDPRNDKAVMFPETPSPFDNAEHARVRAAWQAMPQSFIQISPISMETQLAWMQEFVDRLEEPSKSALLKILGAARPFGAFTQAVRETPGLARDWSNFRVGRVTQLITQWSGEHNLNVSTEAPPLAPAPNERARERVESRTHQIAGNDTIEQTIKTRLHQVIDRMSLSDLLRLSIPVQYLISER